MTQYFNAALIGLLAALAFAVLGDVEQDRPNPDLFERVKESK